MPWLSMVNLNLTVMQTNITTGIYVDVMSNRKLLSRLLQHKGVSTEEAKDGREAIAVVTSSCSASYNIIFMDNSMPNMVTLYLRFF